MCRQCFAVGQHLSLHPSQPLGATHSRSPACDTQCSPDFASGSTAHVACPGTESGRFSGTASGLVSGIDPGDVLHAVRRWAIRPSVIMQSHAALSQPGPCQGGSPSSAYFYKAWRLTVVVVTHAPRPRLHGITFHMPCNGFICIASSFAQIPPRRR